MTQYIVVFVTTDSEAEAETIAKALVEEHLAACVNIISPIRSFYRWQGRIADDREWLLMIKTRANVFDALATRVHTLHSYEVPEVIALPILAGAQGYLDWIQQETRGED